jgi:hypothetical protein
MFRLRYGFFPPLTPIHCVASFTTPNCTCPVLSRYVQQPLEYKGTLTLQWQSRQLAASPWHAGQTHAVSHAAFVHAALRTASTAMPSNSSSSLDAPPLFLTSDLPDAKWDDRVQQYAAEPVIPLPHRGFLELKRGETITVPAAALAPSFIASVLLLWPLLHDVGDVGAELPLRSAGRLRFRHDHSQRRNGRGRPGGQRR